MSTTAIVKGEHIAICWLRDLSSMDKREKKGEKEREREKEEKDGRTESNREQTMVSLIASAFCQHTIDVMSLQRAVRSTISLIVIYEQRQVKIKLPSNYRNAFLPRHPCLPRFSILFLRQKHFNVHFLHSDFVKIFEFSPLSFLIFL